MTISPRLLVLYVAPPEVIQGPNLAWSTVYGPHDQIAPPGWRVPAVGEHVHHIDMLYVVDRVVWEDSFVTPKSRNTKVTLYLEFA